MKISNRLVIALIIVGFAASIFGVLAAGYLVAVSLPKILSGDGGVLTFFFLILGIVFLFLNIKWGLKDIPQRKDLLDLMRIKTLFETGRPVEAEIFLKKYVETHPDEYNADGSFKLKK